MKFFEALGKNVRTILAVIVAMCSFTFLFILIKRAVPEGNRDIIMLSAGIVLAQMSNVIQYYFGSSKDKSDRDKADIANEIVNK